MNLEDKKLEFARRPEALPEFHAVTECFDQDEVQRQLARTQMQLDHLQRVINKEDSPKNRMGLHFIFGRALQIEIDQCRMEMLDTPFHCTADYYRHVIEFMGFEEIGAYRAEPYPDEREMTYIHARPDGLLLIWDTYQGHVNGAELQFQWLGRKPSIHPGGGTSGGFYKRDDGEFVYCGSVYAREGIRKTIEQMLGKGSFLSPYLPRNEDMQKCSLVGGYDWREARDLLGDNASHFALEKVVEGVARKRFQKFPLWVQDMLGPHIIGPAYGVTNRKTIPVTEPKNTLG